MESWVVKIITRTTSTSGPQA
ncbi:unnamed protein product [Gulo gulo]|uniref:Uncharacterized protein n=1 Tax=Gulo gulo TaxID=48420 RepID=A0A9X9Q8C3_GULGU|nr:unnamed protein product [Gulo gulo]